MPHNPPNENEARPTLRPHRGGTDGRLRRKKVSARSTAKRRASRDTTAKGARELPLNFNFLNNTETIWPHMIL